MLVVERKPGESIDIGDDIRVTVIAVSSTKRGRRLRIGIEAPPDVLILRSELRLRRRER